jgi:glycosyltransferase involved in cell wall biosynthesis
MHNTTPKTPEFGKITVMIVDDAIAFGGSIVSTSNLIRGLDSSRFQAVFVSSTSQAIIKSKLKESYGTTPVYIFTKTFNYKRLWQIRGAFAQVPRPFRKVLNILLYAIQLVVNVPYIVALVRTIRRHKVDIVQLNNSFGNDEAFFAAALTRRPKLLYFRGYSPQGAAQRRWFTPNIDAFVSVSDYIMTRSVEDGVPAACSHVATPPVIPDEVDPQGLDALRTRSGITAATPCIGVFGRIVNWKGQREAIHACALVRDRFPGVKLFIVGDIGDGDESYLHELKALIHELKLEDNVVFTGYQDNVHEYYTMMDVVLHASITPEPSGRVIFESMSYGTPVVGSIYGGPKEFIDDGVDGFIVDPRRPETMADRAIYLLANPDVRHLMGALGKDKICSTYSKDKYAGQIQEIYLDMLRGRGGAARAVSSP